MAFSWPGWPAAPGSAPATGRVVSASAAVLRRRRRLAGPDTTNRTAASAATPTPDQTFGESTNEAAKSPMAVPIFQNISMEPVR